MRHLRWPLVVVTALVCVAFPREVGQPLSALLVGVAIIGLLAMLFEDIFIG